MEEDIVLQRRFSLWQDREVRFDRPSEVIALRGPEEIVIRVIDNVEDTKGNEGLLGKLTLTNLRLIWETSLKPNTNLSIGYKTVTTMKMNEVESKLSGGLVSCLVLKARICTTAYEFLFSATSSDLENDRRRQASTSLSENLFSMAQMAWKAYENSKPYRELRLRSAITTHNGSQLLPLPREIIRSQYHRFMNMTKNNVFIGRIIFTNIRVVWIESDRAEFNVSIPYIQITSIRLQRSEDAVDTSSSKRSESKNVSCGKEIVVQTSLHAGGFKFGFYAQTTKQTEEVFSELRSLWAIGTTQPLLGNAVEVASSRISEGSSRLSPQNHKGPPSPRSSPKALHSSPSGEQENSIENLSIREIPMRDDQAADEDIFDDAPGDAFAYYAEEEQGKSKEGKEAVSRPVFDPDIGLAIEPLREGVTLPDLWQVLIK